MGFRGSVHQLNHPVLAAALTPEAGHHVQRAPACREHYSYHTPIRRSVLDLRGGTSSQCASGHRPRRGPRLLAGLQGDSIAVLNHQALKDDFVCRINDRDVCCCQPNEVRIDR